MAMVHNDQGVYLVSVRGEIEETVGRFEKTPTGVQFRSLALDLQCYSMKGPEPMLLGYDTTIPVEKGTNIGFGHGYVESVFAVVDVDINGKVTGRLEGILR